MVIEWCDSGVSSQYCSNHIAILKCIGPTCCTPKTYTVVCQLDLRKGRQDLHWLSSIRTISPALGLNLSSHLVSFHLCNWPFSISWSYNPCISITVYLFNSACPCLSPTWTCFLGSSCFELRYSKWLQRPLLSNLVLLPSPNLFPLAAPSPLLHILQTTHQREESKISSWRSLQCSGGGQGAPGRVQMHRLTTVSVHTAPECPAEAPSRPWLWFARPGGNENPTAIE